MTAEDKKVEMVPEINEVGADTFDAINRLGEAIVSIYQRCFMNMPDFIFDEMFSTLMSTYAWQHGWSNEELFERMDNMKEMLKMVPDFGDVADHDQKEE